MNADFPLVDYDDATTPLRVSITTARWLTSRFASATRNAALEQQRLAYR